MFFTGYLIAKSELSERVREDVVCLPKRQEIVDSSSSSLSMESTKQSPKVFRFGAFEVDVAAAEVRKHGTRIRLQQQPFEVLLSLLERHGELVTREELQKKLWPTDTFVDFEHGLGSAINRLREAIGDSTDRPRYIETVPRRGYKFIAALEDDHSVASAQTAAMAPSAKTTKAIRPSPLVVALGTAIGIALVLAFAWHSLHERAGAPTERIDSLAVLPLDNLSRDSEQEYFADGMTDQLITDLAQIPSVRVISRTSIMQYKNVHKSLEQIAGELKVAAVVEGTVQRSGNRVRITAQLIQVRKEKHLWARSYEGDLRDVLALQDHVARDVAAEIRIKLGPVIEARLSNPRPIEPEVYENYLKGRYFWNTRTEEGVHRGIDYFQQAIAKDPRYALAYAGLADSYLVLAGYRFVSPNEVLPLAKAAALKALELDDSLAEAHVPLGALRVEYDLDLLGAEKEFRRAIELNPNYATAHHWYGEEVLAATGRSAEAVAQLKRAEELDPLSRAIGTTHGYVLYLARENDAAIGQLRKTLELDANFAVAHMYLGRAYAQQKMFADAIEEFQKADDLSGGEPYFRAWLGYGYAVSGRAVEARKVLNELKKLPKSKYVPSYDIAAIWMGLGDKGQAIEWLERAYEDHASYFPAVKVEPVFDGLHSDSHFQDLVRRIGLPRD
jgi:TolB-like protein/DNA-binding winged helix-turn-helix (wHTH) protein/tetratricopeptide (TPR) repeat protein